MFEVGGNGANNAFQLATQQCCVQVEEKCCPCYLVMMQKIHSMMWISYPRRSVYSAWAEVYISCLGKIDAN